MPYEGTREAARRAQAHIEVALHHPAVQRGLLGTSLIAFGAFTPAFLPGSNPLRQDSLTAIAQHYPGKTLWTAILLVGVALLLDAWLRLRPGSARAGDVDMRAATALWSLPLIPVPPLFSNDAYSYAAQGWMVHVGMDPYVYGPASAPGPFQLQVDHYWKDTPAPYGPLGLQIQHGIVDLTGHAPFLSAVMMRLPAILAVVVIAACLPRLARFFGGDPHFAFWLAVANPLVLMHVVGGSHNDAIMIAGMVAALWLATSRHYVLAAVIAGVAATVKQPALILIAPIAAMALQHHGWVPRHPFSSWRFEWSLMPRFIVGGIAVACVSIGSFVVVSLATGLGFGWINAMTVPGEVRTPLAPATIVGSTVEWFLRVAGLTAASYDAFDTVRVVFGVLGVVIMCALWLRYGRTEPTHFAAWGLIAFAMCSPALHTWYLLWGGTLLAVCAVRPGAVRVAIWASATLVCYSAVDASFRNGSLAMAVTAIAAIAAIAAGHHRQIAAVLANRRSLPPAEREALPESERVL